jgi:ribosome-associated toxin RatA of RatAB toxin-antitoxin module
VERLGIGAEAAWDRIERVAEFPSFMECVQTVEVLEERALPDGHNEVLTAWEVELDGCLLRWVEREVRSPSRWRIDFFQVQGDPSRYDGHWQIVSCDTNTTEVSLLVDFEIGIPLLRDALDPTR